MTALDVSDSAGLELSANEADGFAKPRIAWGLARAVITVVICGEGIVVLYNIWESKRNAGLGALGFALIAAILALQLFHFSRPGARFNNPLSYTLLGAQVCLTYLPFLIFGQPWAGVPLFVAGSLLLALPRIAGSAGFVLVVASTAVIQSALSTYILDRLFTPVAVATFALDIFLLTRLAAVVDQLTSARDELARLAVAAEQLRFARDLHDLLGISLSAITLKGELAYRLVHKYPAQARAELGEILGIARRALADVRSVATGYQELSLEQECQTAESVLGASEVNVEVDLDYTELPVPVRTMLGTVLREGTTNILRHSKAEHCEISVRQSADAVTLDMVNDGVADDPRPTDAIGGSGVHNVSERVAALHGTVSAGLEEDRHTYRLHVRIPLDGQDQAPRKGPRRAVQDTTLSAVRRTEESINGWPIRTLVALVFLGMCSSAAVHLISLTTTGWQIAAGVGYIAALLVLQLAFFTRPSARLRSPQSYALLFVLACLTYLPLLQLGPAWVSVPGFLAGTALIALPPLAGWSVFVLSVAIDGWHFATNDPTQITVNAASVVMTGLVVFGLIQLTRLVSELGETRRQLARLAIAQERLRFAQDLHELLGRSLSSITLNGELTRRLLDTDPDRAASELTEILHLARQALADVRSVASGYRELSLEEETRSARSVLAAADVEVSMKTSYGELPMLIRTFLAFALREGVTNVLQHSNARHCRVEILRGERGVCIDIVNDGVPADPNELSEGPGSGLRNLTERVNRLGGELLARAEDDGRFHLHAEVPLELPEPA
jgi:signal transduction histidine kinase